MTAKFDEHAKVKGGNLFRLGPVIWVDWDEWGRETWRMPDTPWGLREAKRNFTEMEERWNE